MLLRLVSSWFLSSVPPFLPIPHSGILVPFFLELWEYRNPQSLRTRRLVTIFWFHLDPCSVMTKRHITPTSQLFSLHDKPSALVRDSRGRKGSHGYAPDTWRPGEHHGSLTTGIFTRCFFPLCFPPCEILRACVLCIEEKFPDGPSAVGAQPLKRLRRVAAIGIWRVF